MPEALKKKEAEAMAALSPEDRRALLLLTTCLDSSGNPSVTAAFVHPDDGPAFVCITEDSSPGCYEDGILATLIPTSDGGWASIDGFGKVQHMQATLAALADQLRLLREERLAAALRNGGWSTVPPQHVSPKQP